MKLLVAVLLAATAVTGCNEIGFPFETPAPPSGIRGTVVLGPTCPTGTEPGANDPVPCLTPYSATLVVLDRENVAVARVASGPDGTFTVDLVPGEYVVAPEGGDPYPIAQPVPVIVAPGQYVEVEINYDTGIR
ncbi:hypothetical protein BH24CHL5_BH24CHL5_05910 [soil metagenome]